MRKKRVLAGGGAVCYNKLNPNSRKGGAHDEDDQPSGFGPVGKDRVAWLSQRTAKSEKTAAYSHCRAIRPVPPPEKPDGAGVIRVEDTMSYKQAAHILPPELLREVQDYIDGECIYIMTDDGVVTSSTST